MEDLTGVDDRGGANDFDGKVVREGGVEGLVGFEAAGNVGRPVGVAGLDELWVGPPDDDGLRVPIAEFKPDDDAGCLGASVLLEGSGEFANWKHNIIVHRSNIRIKQCTKEFIVEMYLHKDLHT